MTTTGLTAADTTQITVHIAALRGLYGDIVENLHDAEVCRDLWIQVAEEQTHLDRLIGDPIE
jgi:hypothetical protein